MKNFKMETLHAFLAMDDDGNEGIIAAEIPVGSGRVMPLIAGDGKRWKGIEEIGLHICEQQNIKYRIAKFVRVPTDEEIN